MDMTAFPAFCSLPEYDVRVFFSTFGCKTNQAELGHLSAEVEQRGMTLATSMDEADVVVVNTCAVTAQAEKKARNLFRRTRREHPNVTLVATGCMAESEGTALKEFGVDIVITNAGKTGLLDLLAEKRDELSPISAETGFGEYAAPGRQTGRTRAFVKVQDGCDAWCSYCIIPSLRGAPRSRDLERVIEEITHHVSTGYREIVLTGIHVGKYGTEPGTTATLSGLLKAVIAIPGDFRIRITSLEPTEVTDEILDIVGTSGGRICPHFHIPLQSGSDRILSAMNRTYTRRDYIDTLARIKSRIPNATTGADVIVGFPGETDEDFADTVDAVRQAGVDFLHVFSYSVRRNTRAADMPDHVAPRVADVRAKRLRAIGHELMHEAAKRLVGTRVQVLTQSDNTGLTDTYFPVRFDEPVAANLLVTAELSAADADGTLHAKVCP